MMTHPACSWVRHNHDETLVLLIPLVSHSINTTCKVSILGCWGVAPCWDHPAYRCTIRRAGTKWETTHPEKFWFATEKMWLKNKSWPTGFQKNGSRKSWLCTQIVENSLSKSSFFCLTFFGWALPSNYSFSNILEFSAPRKQPQWAVDHRLSNQGGCWRIDSESSESHPESQRHRGRPHGHPQRAVRCSGRFDSRPNHRLE